MMNQYKIKQMYIIVVVTLLFLLALINLAVLRSQPPIKPSLDQPKPSSPSAQVWSDQDIKDMIYRSKLAREFYESRLKSLDESRPNKLGNDCDPVPDGPPGFTVGMCTH